ncbi:magnesium chelatase, partial [Thermodesulfobacteriota bacterium]
LIVATANPEDYTNRGRIITPLKDRFDVQLRTHYPLEKSYEIEIMEQEVRRPAFGSFETNVPIFMKEILAERTFQARSSPDINQHSGVSCRVSIRSYESIMGSALNRCLEFGEKLAVPRITDLESTYPAVIGKLELEYDAAERNDGDVLETLTNRAIKVVFNEYFQVEGLSSIVYSFQNGASAEVSQFLPSQDYMDGYDIIPGLREAVQTLVNPDNPSEAASAIEFILEGLHLSNKLNRQVVNKRIVYK